MLNPFWRKMALCTFAVFSVVLVTTAVCVRPLQSQNRGQWVTECVDCPRIFGQQGTDRSMRLDTGSHPHIAYGGMHLYYAWHDGTQWHYQTVDDTPEVGRQASLALDSTGRPHISYFDQGRCDLKYARYDGTTWHVEIVDDIPRCGGQYTSLAMDSSDQPHIGYYRFYYDALGNKVYKLMHAWYDGAAWHKEEVKTTAFGLGNIGVNEISLALDGSDRPHISYCYEDLSMAHLEYAWYDGTTWHFSEVASAVKGWDYVNFPSLALDSMGRPHISYRRPASGLWYAWYDETQWHRQTVDGTLNTGYYSSLALDNAGRPYISYQDTNNDLKHAWHDGTTWHIETVDSTGDTGYNTSLAIDTSGRPHISYYDYTNGSLKYAHHDGTVWRIEIVDISSRVGRYNSLALDAQDRPHISYYDATNGDLKYARYDGATWHIETVDSVGDVGQYTSLALDAQDRPHITYCLHQPSYLSCDDLKYAYFTGTSWHIETIDSTGDVGRSNSLTLDVNGWPHVSYYDDTNDALKYARFNGTNWHIETVDSGLGYGGGYTSLALDANGWPHISYFDDTNDAIKYARFDGTNWHTEMVDRVGVAVGFDTSLALDAFGWPHISYHVQSNDDLKYARYDGTAWHIEIADNNIETGYTSLALDSAGQPYIVHGEDNLKCIHKKPYTTFLPLVLRSYHGGFTPLPTNTPTLTPGPTLTRTPTATPTNTPTPTSPPTHTPTPTSTPPPEPLLFEGFESWPPTGWSIINNGGSCVWESTATTGRANNTGGTGYAADADSMWCGGGAMNTELRTPVLDLSRQTQAWLLFKADFADYLNLADGYVDISTNGGSTWVNLLHYDQASYPGPRTEVINLTPYVGSANTIIRFRFVASSWGQTGHMPLGVPPWWVVDEVTLSNQNP